VTGPTLADLREAQAGLLGVAEHTPLIALPGSRPVRVKAEFRQPIGAFKIRGAWTAVRRLPDGDRARGVVTSSSGNHGLGVAFAAQRHGIPAVVVMPESAPAVKVAGVRALGGEVIQVGKTRGPEQTAEAERLMAERGLCFIPPYDHPDVIAGQGTCGLEILEEWPEVGTLVVPVGGGGLLAGICAAVRVFRPAVRVIAVEPDGIRKLSAARAAGGPVELDGGTSLADGLLTRSVGQLTWPLIAPTVHEVLAVTDPEIQTAMRWLASHGLRVEPSGAVTTAAWLAGRVTGTDPIALVATGGNVDPARYDALVG
jgi:threonine dehydratase